MSKVDRIENMKLDGFTTERPVYFKTFSSGDEYGFRKITFGERIRITEELAKHSKMEGNKITSTEPAEMLRIQMDIIYKTLIRANWQKENEKITKETINERIDSGDFDEIVKFTDSLNFPSGDILEKSGGQSEAKEKQE